jgi:hypothetical protein
MIPPNLGSTLEQNAIHRSKVLRAVHCVMQGGYSGFTAPSRARDENH